MQLGFGGTGLIEIHILYCPGATYLNSVIVSSISSSELAQLAVIDSLHACALPLMPTEGGHAGKPPMPVPLSRTRLGISLLMSFLHVCERLTLLTSGGPLCGLFFNDSRLADQ